MFGVWPVVKVEQYQLTCQTVMVTYLKTKNSRCIQTHEQEKLIIKADFLWFQIQHDSFYAFIAFIFVAINVLTLTATKNIFIKFLFGSYKKITFENNVFNNLFNSIDGSKISNVYLLVPEI